MANFAINSPVVLSDAELTIRDNAIFNHVTAKNNVSGTDLKSFSNNGSMAASSINYANDGMTFLITSPFPYSPSTTRPSVGIVYPRAGK